MKVFIDEKELDLGDWSLDLSGSIRIADHVEPKYGATVSVEYEPGDPWYPWKFGDILTFREPPHEARFMFIADNPDDGAVDPIWVMALFSTHDGWRPGHITTRNRDIFKLAEDR